MVKLFLRYKQIFRHMRDFLVFLRNVYIYFDNYTVNEFSLDNRLDRATGCLITVQLLTYVIIYRDLRNRYTIAGVLSVKQMRRVRAPMIRSSLKLLGLRKSLQLHVNLCRAARH